MQNDDGGWGAFDRNNDRQFLCYVPFADHNAMIDPSTPDLTGRVLEALGKLGRRVGDAGGGSGRGLPPPQPGARRKLVRPLGRELHLRHLAGPGRPGGVGVPSDDPAVVGRRPTGSWPTSSPAAAGANRPTATTIPSSAARARPPPRRPPGPCWGSGRRTGAAPGRARRHPLPDRHADRAAAGHETEFTGTGFPRVFYLRYHYYPIYFPLLALAHWAARPSRGPLSRLPLREAGRGRGSRAVSVPSPSGRGLG